MRDACNLAFWLLTIVVLAGAAAGPVWAGEETAPGPEAPPAPSLFTFTVTDSFVRIGGRVNADLIPGAGAGSGTRVRLRQDLGIEDSPEDVNAILRFELDPADRLEAHFGYLRATGRHTAPRTLAFDHPPDIPEGHELDSTFTFMRYGVAYDRRLVERGPVKLWLGLGADNTSLKQEIQDLDDRSISKLEDVRHAYDFSGRFSASWQVKEALTLNLDAARSLPLAIEGVRHNDARVGLSAQWDVTRRLGLLAGYSVEQIRIRDEAEDPPGRNFYDVTANGFMLGLKLAF